MTVGLTDLLDLAISPQIGPVNFFHLRNLLHTIVEHFGIGEIEAQQAQIRGPHSVRSSSSQGASSSDEDSQSEKEESETDSVEDDHVVEEEVMQTIIDEDGQEKTVTVMIQKPAKPKRQGTELHDKDSNEKDGERRKKRKDKEKTRYKDDKDSSRENLVKKGDEKDDKKKKRDKDRSSGYGTDSAYGKKEEKKKEKKMTTDSLSEAPEMININRRLEAAETGIKGLRNIIDSMVNQVDFGDDVGGILKAQLDQVQQQLSKVELLPEGEAAKKEKKRKGSKGKGTQEVKKEGIITEGSQQALANDDQSINKIPEVIPPPAARVSQDLPKLQPGQISSRQDEKRNVSLSMKGEITPSQGEKTPLRKRTTMEDLKLRKKAREEGVTIEEIEARQEAQESKKENKDKETEKGKEDEKEKAEKKKGEESSSDDESLDSEEEREAMQEMILEEIELALENKDDPESQAYALRLSIERMNNMRKSFAQSQEEFKKEMEKNRRAIDSIVRDLAAFRSARKAQDAEGFNAVHHVHSMVLELQTKHEKLVQTTTELVNEYNRREKSLEELYNAMDRLEQNKADREHVNQKIGIKADKGDLESKVSLNQFDESFNLLDRGLSDALEKMESQMSIEDALKETLQELQSKLHLKLDRQELDSLRDQLESRIREVQVIRTTVKEKHTDDGEPAGFRRNRPEKVHCISCDRPLEVQPGEIGPNMPKMQSLPGQKSSKPYTTFELEHIRQHQKMNTGKKPPIIAADLGYHAQKLKNEVAAMTGLVDMIDLPPSQRYCGGSHTIMHPYRRSFKSGGAHFNQYVVIREENEASVALPRRDFIVPRDNNLKRYTKPKLPAIGQSNTREASPSPEYIAEFTERPLSAPATPSVGHSPQRQLNSPQPLRETVNQSSSPVEMEKITVTIPSPGGESYTKQEL
ncbi:glutamine-rich protein 2-like isoform X1 [Montipora capricornis]|uniref:glutamine-rich protein 2-like isoform X1 n=1 Tax=Montipora capricornis TaxID=246305 RepID=UPI0035F191E6